MTTKSTPSLLRPGDERAQVDVEVEREAHLEQQAALEHAGRHLGRADRAEQDRVERAQLVEHGVGQHLAVAQVARAAEVVVDGVERDAGGRARTFSASAIDLGADAVAADDGDAVGAIRRGGVRHGRTE